MRKKKGVIVEEQPVQTFTVSEGVGNYPAEDLEKIYRVANSILGEAFEVRAIAHSQATASGQLSGAELEKIAHQAKQEATSFAIMRSAFRQHVKENQELARLRADNDTLRRELEDAQLELYELYDAYEDR